MSDSGGLDFFAEVAGLAMDEILDSGFFSILHSMTIAIKNGTSKPWNRAWYSCNDGIFRREPADHLEPGQWTVVQVKPPEGFMNLNYHMEFDCYYNKTDKEEAFFRGHWNKNTFETYADNNDTAPWNNCKFETNDLTHYGAAPTIVFAKLIVVDNWYVAFAGT